MRRFNDASEAARALGRSWIAIGNFDGFHVGHRRVVAEAVAEAGRHGLPALAMTFRPHPAVVLGGSAPARLCSEAQLDELLQAAGLQAVHRHPFDAAFAALEPEAFVRDVACGELRAAGVVVGAGFRFGRGRRGQLALLREVAEPMGVPVIGVPAVVVDGAPVSSSRIRQLLAAGDVAAAEALLERPHAIEGTVVRGEQRGRQIGFPTANVACEGAALPAVGVYACALSVSGRHVPAVANVGRRPTFGGGAVGLEVHALEAVGDLYGAVVRVAFLARLRDERRFDGVAELKEQIGLDVAAAREVLAVRPAASLDGVPGA